MEAHSCMLEETKDKPESIHDYARRAKEMVLGKGRGKPVEGEISEMTVAGRQVSGAENCTRELAGNHISKVGAIMEENGKSHTFSGSTLRDAYQSLTEACKKVAPLRVTATQLKKHTKRLNAQAAGMDGIRFQAYKTLSGEQLRILAQVYNKFLEELAESPMTPRDVEKLLDKSLTA
ncbi:unnamed protein product, partial [Amoebophrya sp. A120]|eukprot:GSA120T00009026001.1